MELALDGGGQWANGQQFQPAAGPGGGVTVAGYTDAAGPHVRLYYQDASGAILEYAYDDGQWQPSPQVVPVN